jgi:RND family efflux transporter MFP subunit
LFNTGKPQACGGWSRHLPQLALSLSVVIAIALGTSCATKTAGAGTVEQGGESAAVVVPVAKVSRTNLTSEMVLTGEFIPYQEIDVMAKEAGYIKSIRVDIGDRVHQGQLLAELEIPEMQDDIARAAAAVQASEADISTARGDLNRAQSAYDIANLSYRRILDVSKKEVGLVPQQEVDVAHSKQLEAAAQVSAAESNLETAQRKFAMAKAEQSRWATLQQYTIIAAPFAGVVTKRYANTGAMIQQGTASETQAMPVVRLSQNDLLRLILPVPESAVPSIHSGEQVDVTVNALNSTFPGRVTRFEDKIDMATRTMNTEVDVPNSRHVLIPGMYAEVKVFLKNEKETLSLPLDGIEGLGSSSARAYVLAGGERIHIVPIKTGLETQTKVQILAGLREGDMVVVGRRTGLTEGQQVQPKLATYEAD